MIRDLVDAVAIAGVASGCVVVLELACALAVSM
jgi:hypothetical protein